MVQKGEATAEKSLWGLVAMATVHTLRVGEGLEYANQTLGWHPQPPRACVSLEEEVLLVLGGSGRGWRNSGGGWGARGQSWVGLPALPSVTGWEMDPLAK